MGTQLQARNLAGAVLIGAVVPVTFIFVMPANRRPLEGEGDLGSAETRKLGGLATAAMMVGLLAA